MGAERYYWKERRVGLIKMRSSAGECKLTEFGLPSLSNEPEYLYTRTERKLIGHVTGDHSLDSLMLSHGQV